ncbi:hypothetical protein CN918_27400 [Priestia megaterium]|nr:hypothetical protein CN918_27400 [Priestia megaterium]
MKNSVKALLVGGFMLASLAACGTTEGTKETGQTKKETTSETKTVKKEEKHKSYIEYADQLAKVKQSIDKYTDVKVALQDGYHPEGPYVPGMGYHFVNKEAAALDASKPNTLLYVLDKKENFVLVAGEWAIPEGVEKPNLFKGIEWSVSTPAGGAYDDGTFIPSKSADVTPEKNPDTGAKLVAWTPKIYGIHMYTHIENKDGLFADYNKTVSEKYDMNAKGKVVPPIEKYLTK